MHYIDSLEKAINYIEGHLDEDVNLAVIAKEAGYSLYHFHRIFKGIIGDSIKDYIRKRRITESAKELVYTNRAIIEIGTKYGYESREAFSRAFEKIYGRNPSEVRRDKLLYCVREPMDFNYMMFTYKAMKEGLTPLYRKFPQGYVVGKRWTVKTDGSNLQDIPLFWQAWNSAKEGEKIVNRKYPNESMGICMPSDGSCFDYMIGQEVESIAHVPKDMEVYSLEPGVYAVFKTLGPVTESVQKTWDYIYSVWLNESGYKHKGTHDIEYYYFNQGELTVDICVPIF